MYPNTPKLMRAATLTGPRQFQITKVPLPELKTEEVLIRLQGSGVCASNIASWEGMPWTKYPLEPGALGHEGWGTVEAVGSQVKKIKVGQKVAALSYHAYAEYDVASENSVVPIPEAYSSTHPFPGEALGCAMNIFQRSQLQKGHTVAIIGVGFLGALLVQLAASNGANVIAISRRKFSLEIAKKMGAQHIVEMDDHLKIIQKVKQITQNKLCDVTIEAVGTQWPLDLASEIVRERGKLVIAGYHQDGPRQVNMQLWNWKGLDVVNAHERDSEIYITGIKKALEAIEKGMLTPLPLYTHFYPLEQIGHALNSVIERPKGFLKAIVTL